MSGDVTYQALERLTHMPDSPFSNQGDVIAGQKYYDVYITGGEISGIEPWFTAINDTPIGNITPSTGAFTTLAVNNYSVLLGGNISTGGSFSTSGAHSLTFTLTGDTSITLPTSGTLITDSSTSTLTNKTLASPIVTGILTVSANANSVFIGDNTNTTVYQNFNNRALFGYATNAVVQGSSGKGIDFCVNNATFGSGKVVEISSSGVVNIAGARSEPEECSRGCSS